MAIATFDQTDNPEASRARGEAEAVSLQEGERIVQAQEEAEVETFRRAREDAQSELRYANKFKSAEDLEKAYLELQRKLGEAQAEDEEGDDEEAPQEGEEEADEGEEDESPDEEGEEGSEDEEEATQQALSPEDQQAILDNVGGLDTYNQAIQWAADNIPQEEQALFNSILESGDANLINFAVTGLVSRFKATGDYEGATITGKSPKATGVKPFRSQAELAKAIGHPDYHNDPAYRMDVEARLAVSPDDLL